MGCAPAKHGHNQQHCHDKDQITGKIGQHRSDLDAEVIEQALGDQDERDANGLIFVKGGTIGGHPTFGINA